MVALAAVRGPAQELRRPSQHSRGRAGHFLEGFAGSGTTGECLLAQALPWLMQLYEAMQAGALSGKSCAAVCGLCKRHLLGVCHGLSMCTVRCIAVVGVARRSAATGRVALQLLGSPMYKTVLAS